MIKTWTRQASLQLLMNSIGDFKAGTCKEDDSWYQNKNLVGLRQFINESTSYLDKHEVSFRFRMLCFRLNLTIEPICYLCKNRLVSPKFCTLSFRPTCEDSSCRRAHRSCKSKEMHQARPLLKKKEIAKKIGIANSRSFDEKFGVEKSNILKQKIANANKSRVQSIEEKIKRVETRKRNNEQSGRCWLSNDAKEKISISNKKTHSSEEFRQKNKDIYQASRIKQSITMKTKIHLGEFTPNSNNWKRSVSFRINVNGENLRFRSKWEAVYYLVSLSQGDRLEYEKIRVQYEFEGSCHIYVIDFLSKQKNQIIEIRPKCRQTALKEIAKFNSAKSWAEINNFKFQLIDETWYQENWKAIQQTLDEHPEIKESLKFKCPI